jgi:hypothetical protein
MEAGMISNLIRQWLVVCLMMLFISLAGCSGGGGSSDVSSTGGSSGGGTGGGGTGGGGTGGGGGGGGATTGSISLAWDANTESDLGGYKVYYGTASRTYGTPIDVGNVTSHKAEGLTIGQTYYFAVTAYDTSNNESDYSNEASGLPK